MQNTPLGRGSGLDPAFIRCCRLAGIETSSYDMSDRLVEHADLHSLRRTFATNWIISGADPKSIQEILGHRTLDTTMCIYAKVKASSKRLTVGKLSYGQGVTAPEHVLPLEGPAKGGALPPSLPLRKTGEGS